MKSNTAKNIAVGLVLCISVVFSIIFATSSCSEDNTTQIDLNDDLICRHAKRAINFLKKLQQENGQITLGDQNLFNVWETIQAARAISLWQNEADLKQDASLQSALAFLKSAETPDGMVLHTRDNKKSYCIEASAEYVRLLAYLENKNAISDGTVTKKVLYVRKNQLPSGAWNIKNAAVSENLQDFPSVTGYVLGMFLSANMTPLDLKAALRFLKEKQNKNGHWGTAWQYYGTPYYATAPILESTRYHNTDGSFDGVISKAKQYLLNSQRDDGSFFTNSDKCKNRPSAELETALALRSLLQCNVSHEDIHIKKGIHWILRHQQEDGSWEGGLFPIPNQKYKKKEDVFCTSQVLMLLYNYIGITSNSYGMNNLAVKSFTCKRQVSREFNYAVL